MNDNLERYSIFLDKYVLTDSGHNFYSIKQEMLSLNHNKFRGKMWNIKEGRKTGKEKAKTKVEKRKLEKAQRGRKKEDGKKENMSAKREKNIRENQKKREKKIHKEKIE